MSWGYRVTLLTAGFVCFMLFLVINAFYQTFDLVAEDYYGKELKFQAQIEKQANQQQLKDPVSCVLSEQALVIQFPEVLSGKNISGSILLFRPSDAKKDVLIPLNCSAAGTQQIPLTLFSKGMYRIQIDYETEGIGYYYEQYIMIP